MSYTFDEVGYICRKCGQNDEWHYGLCKECYEEICDYLVYSQISDSDYMRDFFVDNILDEFLEQVNIGNLLLFTYDELNDIIEKELKNTPKHLIDDACERIADAMGSDYVEACEEAEI